MFTLRLREGIKEIVFSYSDLAVVRHSISFFLFFFVFFYVFLFFFFVSLDFRFPKNLFYRTITDIVLRIMVLSPFPRNLGGNLCVAGVEVVV